MAATRERLETLRDRLADCIATADEKSLPSLAREYRATLSALDAIPSAEKTSKVDELRARRAARPAKSTDRARTASG